MLFALHLAIAGAHLAAQSRPPASALSRYDFAGKPAAVLALPPELRELSGLAVLPDGSWLAHDDEIGVIRRRARGSGDWVPFVRFDRAEAAGDFEAIAVADGWVWLQQSDGRRRGRRLPPAAPTADQRQLQKAPCEVEALLATSDFWWAPCKRAGHKGGLLMLRQARGGGAWSEAWKISGRALLDAGLPRVLGVSDAVVDSATGHWLLVAGPERWLVEVTPDGRLVAAAALDRARHPQPEGLAILRDGTLLIGDEGRRVGTITSYAARAR